MTDEFGHGERLAKLRKTTLDAVEALATEPEALTDRCAEAFTAALKQVKLDASMFAKPARPRGMTLGGPGWEAQGDPAPDTRVHGRAEQAAVELRRELKVAAPREREGTQLAVVREDRPGGGVAVGRDRSNSFVCVVRHEGSGAVQYVCVLRADEDPGRNFCNRMSRFAHWRKTTRLLNELLSDKTLSSAADVFKWCERL
jgi:hypothetical protein